MRHQCRHCPWKVTTNPHDIPDGYCVTKHANLKNTIAKPGVVDLRSAVRMMACHETKRGRELPCIGWLANQLNQGNNIALRLLAMKDTTLYDFELVGDQHMRLEDTLPRS